MSSFGLLQENIGTFDKEIFTCCVENKLLLSAAPTNASPFTHTNTHHSLLYSSFLTCLKIGNECPLKEAVTSHL